MLKVIPLQQIIVVFALTCKFIIICTNMEGQIQLSISHLSN
jgi:hypothetical protein